MRPRKIAHLLLSISLIAPLAACQTTSEKMARKDRQEKIDAVLERAENQASSMGNGKESLALLERMYKRDSGNEETAIKYAAALRESGRLNRASVILEPLVEKEDASANALIEYASIQAALGNYEDAESSARRAVLKDPNSGQAYHVLGIALDAQGHSPQAEIAFRKGLEHWEGDPSPILNNLGLNLATQGFLDEAIETLRKAAALAPGRSEIERNLRIVSALQVQPPKEGMRLIPPKPGRKPGKDKPGKDELADMDKAYVPPAPEKTEPASGTIHPPLGVKVEQMPVEPVEAQPVSGNDQPEADGAAPAVRPAVRRPITNADLNQ